MSAAHVAFNEMFVERRFGSFHEFVNTLNSYMKTYFVTYVRTSSDRTTLSRLRFNRAIYRCVEKEPRKSKSRGKRQVHSRNTHCKAGFTVKRSGPDLVVNSCNLNHNHELNHWMFERHAINRRLTEEQGHELQEMFLHNATNSEIRRFFREKHGKHLTAMDVVNHRKKITPAYLKPMTKPESADEFEEESEYEVEELLDIRYRNGEPEYLIKWKGHPACYREMNSWEPEYNLNCPKLLREFNSKQHRQKTTIVDIPETTEPYGFDRGLAPDCISMVTRKDGELYFLIKWKGSPVFDVVPAAQANTRCPQIVIRFYESILHFT